MGILQRLGSRLNRSSHILESFQHRITTSVITTLSAERRVLTEIVVGCCRKEFRRRGAEAEDMMDYGYALPIKQTVALFPKKMGSFFSS